MYEANGYQSLQGNWSGNCFLLSKSQLLSGKEGQVPVIRTLWNVRDIYEIRFHPNL